MVYEMLVEKLNFLYEKKTQMQLLSDESSYHHRHVKRFIITISVVRNEKFHLDRYHKIRVFVQKNKK